ncbi:MAG: DUF5317 domain-containing protein [Clostridiaceae bacterium]|jgi:hypothetical protein|nr:DUF5317 domain-containing protein [Clostridiaceae bacterium]
MILAACLLGVVLGLLAGGRWRSIWCKRFRVWPLLFLSLFCEWLLASVRVQTFLVRFDQPQLLRALLAVLQYGLVSVFLARNWRKPGLLAVLAGSLLNGLVIVANGGRMPVGSAISRFGAEALDKLSQVPHYFAAGGQEPLLFFADLIPFAGYMISVGDILIALGLFLLGLYLPFRLVRPTQTLAKP